MSNHDWELRVDDVDPDSHREEPAFNLTELAVSIAELGVIRPISLTPEGKVLSGGRRLVACRELGLSHIPAVTVLNLPEASERLAADLVEETGQLAMMAGEKVSVGRMLEELPRPEGLGEARTYIAAALGVGGRTWEMLRAIVEAVEAEELPSEVLDEIDRTNRAKPVYERLKRQRDGTEPPPPKRFVINSDRTQAQADKAREGMRRVIGGLDGYRDGIENHFDIQKAVAGADPSEIEEWRSVLNKTTRTLSALRTRLKEETEP